MWTGPPDPNRSPTRRPSAIHPLRFLLLPVVLLALLPLAACSDDAPPPSSSGGAFDDVAQLMQRTLNVRAAALRQRDEARFRRTLDRSDAALVEQQVTYFHNISQLPVGVLRLRLDADTVTPEDGTGDYWAEVVVVLRLDGYDAAAVRTLDRYRFTPSKNGARMVIASTTDHAWEADRPGNAQPWDLGRVHVEQAVGVLGIFDDATADHAEAVVEAASNGQYDVRAVVGADDSPSSSGVVVYSLADPAFLRGLAGRTVGDPDRADGLTIAVPVDASDLSKGVASYRMFLNPRVLDVEPGVLGRLVRHELTHATLGKRGHGAPLWLSEGIAEYVSVRQMPPGRRRLPASALSVGGAAEDLPGEEEFSGAQAEAWYAVSWWVCEYVASTYGEQMLFELLDRLADGADQDDVLPEVLGITPAQLTQRGVALMTTTYDR
ncbi:MULTISPECIES: hypothetical protein [Nocardioides]|uniref:Peptidase MA-like domain-containing protein n=1 Tax=Nocardioides vastitatis TaxID=2568655 RepID=A0ABW0ZJU1_9ACTN|nr:hypothetical protein [Nocardioides sp.]THJ01638.1 hypothetical protein E7Z54_11135 [Nocardioides sp.]